MERRRPVALALAPLLVAGAALAFLGVRSLRLEGAEAARSSHDWANNMVSTLRELAPRLAAAEPYPADEVIHLVVPAAPFDARADAVPADDRLLLDEARYLEQAKGDDVGALALAKRLAEPADAAPMRAVAALRAGALARRVSDPAAAQLLEQAAAASPDVAEACGLPVAILALRHLAALDLAAGRPERVVKLLDATHDGADLREDGGVDGGDLVLAAAADVQSGISALPAAVAARLSFAAARARRGHRLLAALAGRPVATDGSFVAARGKDGEVTVRSLEAFGTLLARRIGADVGVSAHGEDAPAGATAFASASAPLDGLAVWARADPAAQTARGWWLLGAALLVYAVGAALSLAAIRNSTRAARMQADFVASVSHEMKTPIAAVQAMAEMLADGRVPDASRARAYALRMQAEMQRLGATVRNVLDAARIERGTGPLVALRPLDPAAVVTDIAGVVRPVLEARGFRFEVDAKPAARLLRVDPDALASVLANLLDNAAKFSGDAKEVSVEAGPVGNGAAGTAARGYRVRVMDRGPGVPAADRERVFQRFWRGDAARAGAVPGVGLGLHVARELVAAHGGTLRVEDREGGGAAFVVDLPEEPA